MGNRRGGWKWEKSEWEAEEGAVFSSKSIAKNVNSSAASSYNLFYSEKGFHVKGWRVCEGVEIQDNYYVNKSFEC